MNTILLSFACVLLGVAAILASPIGRPSERQERSLKKNEEVTDFLNKEFGHWRSRLRRYADETNEDETGEDETDEGETDEDETDEDETGEDETDEDETDEDETDEDETGEDETDEDENDGNENDGNEPDEDTTDANEPDEDTTDANEPDEDTTDATETDEDQSGQADNETLEVLGTPSWSTIDNDNETYLRKRSASQGGRRPRKTDLTYVIMNFTKHRPEKETKREVKLAFKAWSDVTPLKFTETKLRNASFKLTFRNFSHAVISPMVIALTGGNTVTFDEHKDWSGPNLRLVAIHEIGHLLGLGDTKNQKSIMYERYIDRKKNFNLGPEDIERIQAKYGKKKKNSNSRRENYLSTVADTGILSPIIIPPARPTRSTAHRSQGSKQTGRMK